MTNSHAKQTCLVVLGSSEYPNYTYLSNPQFKRSADAVRGYFAAEDGFGLTPENVLDLFDHHDNWVAQINEATQFVKGFSTRLASEDSPLNVLIYCIGHGYIPESKNAFYLCLRDCADRDGVNGLMDVARLNAEISNALPRHRICRLIYFIDACFSGQAAISIRGSSSSRDIALLCSVDKNNPGLAQEGKDHTLFTELLLEALKRSSPLTSFWSLKDLHREMKERVGQRGVAGLPVPELHDPKSTISEVKLFPAARIPEPAGKVIRLLVIERKLKEKKPKTSLSKVAKQVRTGHYRNIIDAANEFRRALGIELVPVNPTFIDISVQYIDDSLSHKYALQKVVAELCQADIAAFDLTDWDAGAIFLLGVRSVVRRGITVCSTGEDGEGPGALSASVPFNLQLLNISSHSASSADVISQHFADKIVTGFRELAALPSYLDLPSYDLVRQLGYSELHNRIVPYSEGALVLCSFEASYTKQNWNDYLRGDFLSEWQGDVSSSQDRQPENSPKLQRLLDIVTPRLIAHKLFEVIRLTDLCLIDWTGMRPNVIFEAGVRMAVHPLGAVHILDKDFHDPTADSSECALIKLFYPIRYEKDSVDGAAHAQEMIRAFKKSKEAFLNRATGVPPSSPDEANEFNFIYEYAGRCLDVEKSPPAMPLVDEMIKDANFLHMEDEESVGSSSLLYFEVNKHMKDRAVAAASERRLAAWFYLSRRWTAAEIVADVRRKAHFDKLAEYTKMWARKNGRDDIRKEVNDLMAEVAKVNENPRESVNGALAP